MCTYMSVFRGWGETCFQSFRHPVAWLMSPIDGRENRTGICRLVDVKIGVGCCNSKLLHPFLTF